MWLDMHELLDCDPDPEGIGFRSAGNGPVMRLRVFASADHGGPAKYDFASPSYREKLG
jgi:hypothetical protein